MAVEQFLVIVYDISSDKRRARLHDTLLNFGTPVQYSVFECLIKPKDLPKLKQAVRRVIRPKVDHVRYYYLCAQCVGRVEISSGVEVLRPGPGAVVVGGDEGGG